MKDFSPPYIFKSQRDYGKLLRTFKIGVGVTKAKSMPLERDNDLVEELCNRLERLLGNASIWNRNTVRSLIYGSRIKFIVHLNIVMGIIKIHKIRVAKVFGKLFLKRTNCLDQNVVNIAVFLHEKKTEKPRKAQGNIPENVPRIDEAETNELFPFGATTADQSRQLPRGAFFQASPIIATDQERIAPAGQNEEVDRLLLEVQQPADVIPISPRPSPQRLPRVSANEERIPRPTTLLLENIDVDAITPERLVPREKRRVVAYQPPLQEKHIDYCQKVHNFNEESVSDDEEPLIGVVVEAQVHSISRSFCEEAPTVPAAPSVSLSDTRQHEIATEFDVQVGTDTRPLQVAKIPSIEPAPSAGTSRSGEMPTHLQTPAALDIRTDTQLDTATRSIQQATMPPSELESESATCRTWTRTEALMVAARSPECLVNVEDLQLPSDLNVKDTRAQNIARIEDEIQMLQESLVEENRAATEGVAPELARSVAEVLQEEDGPPPQKKSKKPKEKQIYFTTATLKKKFNLLRKRKVYIPRAEVVDILTEDNLQVLDLYKLMYHYDDIDFHIHDMVDFFQLDSFDLPEPEFACDQVLREAHVDSWTFPEYMENSRRGDEFGDEQMLLDTMRAAKSLGADECFNLTAGLLGPRKRSLKELGRKSRVMKSIASYVHEGFGIDLEPVIFPPQHTEVEVPAPRLTDYVAPQVEQIPQPPTALPVQVQDDVHTRSRLADNVVPQVEPVPPQAAAPILQMEVEAVVHAPPQSTNNAVPQVEPIQELVSTAPQSRTITVAESIATMRKPEQQPQIPEIHVQMPNVDADLNIIQVEKIVPPLVEKVSHAGHEIIQEGLPITQAIPLGAVVETVPQPIPENEIMSEVGQRTAEDLAMRLALENENLIPPTVVDGLMNRPQNTAEQVAALNLLWATRTPAPDAAAVNADAGTAPVSTVIVTKDEVYRKVSNLCGARPDPIMFLHLCPKETTSRAVAAQTFSRLLSLHAEKKIHLDTDPSKTYAEAIFIFPALE